MARTLLPYFNDSVYGTGLEGVANYTNEISNNFLIPAFLMAMYGISLFVFSKSGYKMGGGIFFISFLFFILSIVAQTFTTFSQLFIFIFFVGMIAGVVVHFVADK